MARKPEKTKKNLGRKIQRLRKSAGYTQEEFAEMVGISRTHIGHIEQGRKSPSLEIIEKIARILKTKIANLFDF